MSQAPPPSFGEAFRFWFQLGWTSFGGPAAQIAIMHREVVDRRKWVDEQHFLDGLNLCMLLPGPEAQQLSIYLGSLLHGRRGGLAAGLLFILPSVLILYGLALLYVTQGNVPWFVGAMRGLQPVVVAIVAASAVRLATRVLKTYLLRALALASFVAMAVFDTPFPIILLVAASLGALLGRIRPDLLVGAHGAGDRAGAPMPGAMRAHPVRTLLVGLALWWLPVVLLALALGPRDLLVSLGVFFSKVAVITFGGAYAVLPYVANEVVRTYGWVSLDATIAGLAFAETTPGPLIMVLQFLGFVAGWNADGAHALWRASAAAALTTWVTFVPCFLWIFLLAPYVARVRHIEPLRHALTAVSATVVGVIVTLGVWFARHALSSEAHGVDWLAAATAGAAYAALRYERLGLTALVGIGVALGLLRQALGW